MDTIEGQLSNDNILNEARRSRTRKFGNGLKSKTIENRLRLIDNVKSELVYKITLSATDSTL